MIATLLMTQLDPMIGFASILAILTILVGLVLRKFKQPYIIGYILVGVILGKHGFALIENPTTIEHLGEIGVILLLFFIGMEISLPELVKQWKIASIGTLLQVGLSVAFMLGIGYLFDWHFHRSIILGFVIALSSSAVIIKIIQDKNLATTRMGKNVLSILLTQDIIVVPLLICTAMLGGKSTPAGDIFIMIMGGVLIVAALIYLYKKRVIKIPFTKQVESDHELQVFMAILMCFGGALIASLFNLSPALGAFVGGMIIHASTATDWIYKSLHSFRVLFVALFFVSIGLQIDLLFIYDNVLAILIVLLAVYLVNHLLNSLILRLFSGNWKEALLGGALLAQIGELSFLISFSAYQLGILVEYGYKFTISLISLTLIISPFWISLTEYAIALHRKKKLKISNNLRKR